MVTVGMNRIIRYLRNVALGQDDGGLTDGELLERFLTRRDEAAFTGLVKRYGPMVLGVCQRVLHNRHDAEDAFQATFLVLVRKGSSVVPREMVGNWLYGVAYRTALEARRAAAKRHQKERTMPRPEAHEDHRTDDLSSVLDQELQALPDKYRAPLVLCDLRGKTRREVARQLGCPEGTVAGRLARGRHLLAGRLAKRGLVVSAAGLAQFFALNVTSAAVPATLVTTTVKAATLCAVGKSALAGAVSVHVTALTERVLKAMFLTKMKSLASLLVAVGIVTASLGLVWQETWFAQAHAAPLATGKDTPVDKPKPPGTTDPVDNPAPKAEPAKKEEAKKEEAKKVDPDNVPFTKIHVKSHGKVVITQTGKQALEAKGHPLLVQNVKTGVENDTLHLEGHPGVEFNVEVKDLSGLTVEGIGTVEVKDLMTKRLEVTVKSSGKASVSGSAEEQVIHVSGVGRFDGQDCKGKQAQVKVTGGSAVVNVSDKLQVDIQGVGRVNYLGSPAVEKNVSLTGQLIPGQPANPAGQLGPFRNFNFAGRAAMEGRLGAQLEPPSPTLIDQLGLPEKQGLVLKEVKKDSAADKAGLKTNDVLLELDGKPVPSSPNGFGELLKDIKADQKVAAVVVRKGKKVDVKELSLPEAKNPAGLRFQGQPGGLFPNRPAEKKEEPKENNAPPAEPKKS